MRSTARINEHGGHEPWGGGPPFYHPRRCSSDWPKLPKLLRACSACSDHAALFGPDDRGRYFCGPCVGRVDIFHANLTPADSAVQMRADQALGEQIMRLGRS